jgi:hypothetical protein
VKDLAYVDAFRDELLARILDVGDGEGHCLRRTGRGGCEVYAELDWAAGTRRRELDQTEVVTGRAVGVKAPPEPWVEFLRVVNIRYGDDHHLKLHI